MSQHEKTASFVAALKDAGITISNESGLVQALNDAKDVDRALEKLCFRGNSRNVSFHADLKADSKKLSAAFINHGFDGFTFRSFLDGLRPVE